MADLRRRQAIAGLAPEPANPAPISPLAPMPNLNIRPPRFTAADFGENCDIRAIINKITNLAFEALPDVRLAKNGDDAPEMEGVRVKAFNPEPFISMIEDTINDLDELRDENDINLLTISSECKNAEVAHASAMRSLSNSMDSIFSTFRRLDKRISKVSHTAVSIGHSLETLNYQKKQNILGKSIIQHFIDFNTGDINKIDPLFLTKDPVRIHEAARLIQLLQGVVDELKSKDNNKSRPASTSSASSSLPPPPSSALGGEEKGGGSSNSNSNATSFSSSSSSSSATTSTTTTTGSGTSPLAKAAELITKVSEMIEGTLRERFAESTKLGEDAKSYRVACTLVNFKNHVFDTYIAEAAIALDDHIRNSRKEAPSLKSFSANIRKICKVVLQVVNEQVSRVGRIFPNPMSIMHQIIINMFQFKIKPYVGSVLSDRSVVEDPEKYLRILNVAVVQMRELTQEIVESLSTLVQQQQQLQQQQQQLQQQAANGGLLSPVSSTSTSTSAASTLLSPTNSSSSSSTTTATSTSYGNQSWVSASAESVALSDQISLMFDTHFRGWAVKEVDLLQTVADEQLRQIEKSREDQMQEEKDLFGRTRKVPMSGPKRISWLQEMLSNDMVDRVIKQALTAAKRSDSLAPLGEQASAVESIYMTLLNFLHQRFLLPLLVESFDLLPPQDPKERPDHFFFVVVQLSNEISAKAHRFYVKYVAPRIADSPNVRSVLEMRMHHSKADVEKRIILGLQACLLAATNYCRRLLSQQKSNAYKPRDENTVLDADRVSAWSPMCAFVDSLLATALCTLLGSNLDRFLHLFGVHVHSVVMEHLKKMTGSISNLGAALLARDVQELVATIKGFHLTKLDQLFGDLQALCNIFFVQPSSVRALLTEGSKLSKIDPQTIVDFIKLRADFASNKTLLMSQLSFVTPQH